MTDPAPSLTAGHRRPDVIRTVDTPSSAEVPQQAPPAPADQPTGKGFAALHAAAVARDKQSTGGTAPSTSISERVEAPEGETWANTAPGAHYARIVAGPRTGQYINLTHGDRRGQTFTIENRDGKTVHVYGGGTTEVVVKPAVDRADVSDAAKHIKHRADQPPKGEKWAPVEGHSTYADILEGPRNGLFVNISGGIRDGMAFQIVKKGSKVFHVYGTGKDKQMIEVSAKRKADASADAGATTGSTAAGDTSAATGSTSTGGTAATTGSGTAGTATGGNGSGVGGNNPATAPSS
jgi:hypothetical protein